MNRTVIRRATALGTAAAALTFGLGAGVADATTPVKPVVTLAPIDAVALAPAPATVEPSLMWRVNAKHVQATDVTVTVNATGLARIAAVAFQPGCTVVRKDVATCPDAFVGNSPTTPQTWGTSYFTLTALRGAKPGATGSYTISGSSSQVVIKGGTGQVSVGGPEYTLSGLSDHKNWALGSIVSEPLAFTNTGDRPSAGTAVWFTATPGLRFVDHYSNCEYRSFVHAGHVYQDAALCRFPSALRIGEKVALARPMRFQYTHEALREYTETGAWPLGNPRTAGTLQPWKGHVWQRGTGPVLGLKVVAVGRASGVPAGSVPVQLGTEQHSEDIVSLSARNTDDFGVTGSSATAAAGKTVTMDFTLVSHGPGTLYDISGGEGIPGVEVTPPPGTTIVGSSARCQPSVSFDPGVAAHGPYNCSPDLLIWAGTVYRLSLTLRVDQVVPHATGKVRIVWGPVPGWRQPYDPNPADDSALLQLN
ncbi:hypothetical protein DN069_14705 [Streptacidiphilus pinicola]|uniref:Uncharacterized protein n=1 Tax=Streptacidiphilus pinicola TaxID=2219663 RepID=A0A2X0ING6_9ACTN|nr:hypothetical protein [Streptacidiphilus pinicola]RAG84851.1 hypothetical protein DN069_14705 [Streptacidiphilus pinicola]